jgi:hypothetical protein
MLVWSWYKERKKITWELEQRKTNLKITRTWTMCLKNTKEIKLKETMHLKNENITKKKETLKVWNGIKIITFLKNSIWFSFRIWVQFCFFVMIILGPRGGGWFPLSSNNQIWTI